MEFGGGGLFVFPEAMFINAIALLFFLLLLSPPFLVPDSPLPPSMPLSATSLASPPVLSGGGILTGSSAVRIRQGAARPDTRCLGLPVVEGLVRAGTMAHSHHRVHILHIRQWRRRRRGTQRPSSTFHNSEARQRILLLAAGKQAGSRGGNWKSRLKLAVVGSLLC